MGKSSKQHARRSKHKARQGTVGSNTTTTTAKNAEREDHHGVMLPQPFPQHLLKPSSGFLRDESPYRDSFRAAMEGPYEGFVVDTAENLSNDIQNNLKFEEDQVLAALNKMNEEGDFREDVTQPFGLGTKCAKTYVTRCLVGSPGTSYKYLGLRMFAAPYECSSHTKVISKLGAVMTQRSVKHLQDLDVTRKDRQAPPTKGIQPLFNICLINRMVYKPQLKPTVALPSQPEKTPSNSQDQGKTSVSWHADSSLENYSTIAVYQTLESTNQSKEESNKKWWVGLRVAHHAEGPKASQGRKGSSIESSIIQETPPIAVSLPSGSAYYMLDDFNHHHQHIVFTTGNDAATTGVRYSATFRQLRQSHTVQYWIERSHALRKGFNRKGMNVWHSEHLVHQELEFEWIRQFYVQGKSHYDSLWNHYWKGPMQELLALWGCFEHRVYQTVELLRAAAEAKCGVGMENAASRDLQAPRLSKGDRKERDRRQKALATVEKLLSRGNTKDDSADGNLKAKASSQLFHPIASFLEERANMREQWEKREKDHVFRDMSADCRPLNVPFRFDRPVGESIPDSCEWGSSPFPRSPSKVKRMSVQLRQLGEAFEEGNADKIPPSWKHAVPMDWESWKDDAAIFGLEFQAPWAGAVVNGRKSIETRVYSLPPSLLGKRLYILESQSGKAGVSSLGDHVDIESVKDGEQNGGVRVIGWCVISSVKEYMTRQAFEADESQHLVKSDSGYGWKENSTEVIYGWIVSDYGAFTGERDLAFTTGMRRFRSLFELHIKPSGKTDVGSTSTFATDSVNRSKGNKTKKKRTNTQSGEEKKKKRKRF
jgi:alpha-ketoglutarate-dependent dioxygenase FTO